MCAFSYAPIDLSISPWGRSEKANTQSPPKAKPFQNWSIFFWPPSRQAYFRPLSNNTGRAIHISLWNSSFCHIHTRKKKIQNWTCYFEIKKALTKPDPINHHHRRHPFPSNLFRIHFPSAHTHRIASHSFVRPFVQEVGGGFSGICIHDDFIPPITE